MSASTFRPDTLSARVQRGDVFAAQCPARGILSHVTGRWGVLVLVGLQGRTLRFSELRRKVGGISEKMLAQTLQTLESDGFVERTAYPVVPPHVEYRLSPLGEEVLTRVATLADWIELNLPSILASRASAEALTARRATNGRLSKACRRPHAQNLAPRELAQ